MVAVGHALGLDPRITELINIPVRAAATGLVNGLGVGTGQGGGSPGILQSIKDSLFSSQTLGGLVSVGSSIALDALGAPPVATNFVSNFLGQIAVGLTGGQSGGGGPPSGGEVEKQGQGILAKIGEGISKFGRGLANAVGSVVDFGQKVIEGVGSFTVEGFKKAVRGFSSIFSRETQEGIYKDEAGIKQADVYVDGNGNWVWENEGSRILYDTQTKELVETFGVRGQARITGLGQDEAGTSFYQKLDYRTVTGEGAELSQTYENNRLTGWSYGIEGRPIITVKGPDDQRPWMGEDGRIFEGDVEINPSPILINIPDELDPERPTLFDNLFFNFSILGGNIAEASVEVRSGANPTQAAPGDTSKFIFGNGFNNEVVPEGTFPPLMESFVSDLAFKDRLIDLAKTLMVPLYETTTLAGNIVDWAEDFIFKLRGIGEMLRTIALSGNMSITPILVNVLGSNNLVEEVRQKLIAFEQKRGILDKGIAFVHSGFFAPLLGALELTRDDGTYFDVQTVISYEGPHVNWNDYIDNPNLKRIINVWGTAPIRIPPLTGQWTGNYVPDPLTGALVPELDPTKKPVRISDFGPPFVGVANFSGPAGIENINIEIIGARHNDFSYDPNAWNENPYPPEAEVREINRKTNLFMRLLYQFALVDQETPGRLRFFLDNTTGISFDSKRQIWVVNPDELEF